MPPSTDIGQITIRGHLVLCVELDCPASVEPAHVRRTVLSSDLGGDDRLSVGVAEATEEPIGADGKRLLVTLTSPTVTAGDIAGVFGAVYSSGGTCERIVRLATYPVQSYELVVLGADHERLRASLATESARLGIDLAVQRAGLHRRAKRLVVLDADSTLLQHEVIDLLAAAAGRADEVAAITEAAMAGDPRLPRRAHPARARCSRASPRRRSRRSLGASSSHPARGRSCGRCGASGSRPPS